MRHRPLDRKSDPADPATDLHIFHVMEALTEEHPRALDEPFPREWSDPLELYGCYRASLEARDLDMAEEREAIQELMQQDSYSPATIWHSRLGLAARRIAAHRH